jgi:hypothetical protein
MNLLSFQKSGTWYWFIAFLPFILLISPSRAGAQSNKIVDDLLLETTASYGNASYMVLTAAGLIPESAEEEDALAEAVKRGYNPKGKGIYSPISLGEYSHMLMQVFDIGGGIMYSIFPSPRYASRELGFKGYIKRDFGAYRNVSGREAIQILGRILRERGES